MKNTIKCRYCEWMTMRFRGRKSIGERKLRIHVLDEHEQEYLAAQGLVDFDDKKIFHPDYQEIGEQAL